MRQAFPVRPVRWLVSLLVLIPLAALAMPVRPAQAQVAPPTVVSLTFDDGNADQYAARSILSGHGMQVTPRQQQQIAGESEPVPSDRQATEFSEETLDDLKGEEPSQG